MPKLFIALDLPDWATAELGRIQPPPTPGIRVVSAEQMHVTLHFLGMADVTATVAALDTVRQSAFTLDVVGVGAFIASEATTLFAGVQQTDSLLGLHTALAHGLTAIGFQPEVRPYHPHVTLARCTALDRSAVSTQFQTQHRDFRLMPIPAHAFHLYSSTFGDAVPVYHRERSFPLHS